MLNGLYRAMLVCLVIGWLLAGCAPSMIDAFRVENRERALRDATPTVRSAIERGEILVGMTNSEVIAAAGFPAKSSELRSGGGATEVWMYKDRLRDRGVAGWVMNAYLKDGGRGEQVLGYKFVYLRNGVVTAIGNQ